VEAGEGVVRSGQHNKDMSKLMLHSDGTHTIDGTPTLALVERMIQLGLAARPARRLTMKEIRAIEVSKCNGGNGRTGRKSKG